MRKNTKRRTSLTLTPTVVKQARAVALEEERSLSALVEELLEQYLKRRGRTDT